VTNNEGSSATVGTEFIYLQILKQRAIL